MISRYVRPQMAAVWSPERRLRLWLDVELHALDAREARGEAPAGTAAAVRAATADFPTAEDVERIDVIEATVHHDVIAFLTRVEERAGEPARHLHRGMTSSDVLDTALALQLVEATALLVRGVDGLRDAARALAEAHRHTPMVGRTHGIHAEPTTFGLVCASWWEELGRGRARLLAAGEGLRVGKVSGAVGTFATVPPAVEAHVCAALGLRPDPVSSQIVQRDRHAELFAAVAIVGGTLDRIAVEIRHLQRTEVREAEEPFERGQRGSSAMPHKRNPIRCENVSGLARLLRGYAQAAFEDQALWHERDISHSSVERVIAPDATQALDFMLDRLRKVVAGLVVYPERMAENLELTRGLVYSGALLDALVEKGLARQEAYGLVQRAAMRTWAEGVPLRACVLADPALAERLSPAEIDAALSPARHLAHVDTLFARVFGG